MSSPALKWLIAALLPPTRAWKERSPAENVIAFLMRRGFDAAVDERRNFRRILALNSFWRMRLLIASNDGADRDMMRSLAAVAESLIFVYLGKVYQEQPILLTVSAELWARAPGKLGLTDHHLPVLALVGQNRGDVERLFWDDLSRGSPTEMVR
jgi:hypothetical protein